jgi:protein-ribulosamine 3-kinase
MRLSDRLVNLLADPVGDPSLLHGDLWSGNIGVDTQGQPVMFDPAPYYGYPEAELEVFFTTPCQTG